MDEQQTERLNRNPPMAPRRNDGLSRGPREKSPEERLGYCERLLAFVVEKTGLHHNLDEFHAAEKSRRAVEIESGPVVRADDDGEPID